MGKRLDGPVRKVVSRSHKGFVGIFHSAKSSTPLEFESLLERDFLHLMEVEPTVLAVRAQPIELHWTAGGRVHKHVPDFELAYHNRSEIVEVKPARKAADPALVERTKIITELLVNEGITYRVLTEGFIRREPDLTRAKTLLQGLGHQPSDDECSKVLAVLSSAPHGMSTIEVCERLRASPSLTNSIYAMVIVGQLEFTDRTEPITAMSRVRLASAHHSTP